MTGVASKSKRATSVNFANSQTRSVRSLLHDRTRPSGKPRAVDPVLVAGQDPRAARSEVPDAERAVTTPRQHAPIRQDLRAMDPALVTGQDLRAARPEVPDAQGAVTTHDGARSSGRTCAPWTPRSWPVRTCALSASR